MYLPQKILVHTVELRVPSRQYMVYLSVSLKNACVRCNSNSIAWGLTTRVDMLYLSVSALGYDARACSVDGVAERASVYRSEQKPKTNDPKYPEQTAHAPSGSGLPARARRTATVLSLNLPFATQGSAFSGYLDTCFGVYIWLRAMNHDSPGCAPGVRARSAAAAPRAQGTEQHQGAEALWWSTFQRDRSQLAALPRGSSAVIMENARVHGFPRLYQPSQGMHTIPDQTASANSRVPDES